MGASVVTRPAKNLNRVLKELDKGASDPKRVGTNDGQYLAFMHLHMLDAGKLDPASTQGKRIGGRRNIIIDLEKELIAENKKKQGVKPGTPVRFLLDRAALIRNFAKQQEKDEKSGLMKGYWKAVAGAAQEAEAVWGKVLLQEGAFANWFRTHSWKIVQDPKSVPPIRRLPNNNVINPIRNTLEGQTARLFKIKPPKKREDTYTKRHEMLSSMLPLPAVYHKRLTKFMDNLDKVSRGLELHIIRLAAKPKPGPNLNNYLFLLAWMANLFTVIRAYVPKSPNFIEPDQRDVDELLHNRSKIAYLSLGLGVAVGWSNLRFTAHLALQARRIGHSILVLPGDWVEEERSPLTQFKDEIKEFKALGTGKLPISPKGVVNLFRVEFQKTLLKKTNEAKKGLKKELTLPLKKRGKSSILSLAGAVKATGKEAPRLKKWKVKDSIFLRHPKDPTREDELVLKHPRTLHRLNTDPEWKTTMFVVPEKLRGTASGWTVPLPQLVAFLKQIPEVQTIMEPFKDTGLTDGDWLVELAAVVPDATALTKKFEEKAKEELEGTKDKKKKGMIQQVRESFREVVTLERVLLQEKLRHALKIYKKKPSDYASLPGLLARQISFFEAFITPADDREAQIAALILGLAPELLSVFKKEKSSYIITLYFGLIEGALITSKPGGKKGVVSPEVKAVLHPSERKTGYKLKDRRKKLETLLNHFSTVRSKHQKSFGFGSPDGERLKSLNSSKPIFPGSKNGFIVATWTKPPGSPIPLPTSPYYYELVQIHQPFKFHPGVGVKGAPGYFSPILKVGEEELKEPTGKHLLLTLRYSPAEFEGEPSEIKIKDDELGLSWLTLLSFVVDIEARAAQLRELAAGMEAGYEFIMEAAEYIPGIGHGVAAFNAFRHLEQFLSKEMPAIRKRLLEDPEKLVNEIKDAITELLSGEMLWQFLLTEGNNPLASIKKKSKDKARIAKRKNLHKGRIGRLASAVMSIGVKLYQSVQRIRNPVVRQVRSARAVVTTYPGVTYALQQVPSLLANLQALDVSQRLEVMESLIDSPEGLQKMMTNLLQGLQEIELPGEVIPFDVLTELALAMFMDRLGKKGRATRKALEVTGLLSRISGSIADALRNTRADPNRIWQEEFFPLLNTSMTSARDQLVVDIYAFINTVLPTKVKISPPNMTEMPSLNITRTRFQETEAFGLSTLSDTHFSLPAYQAHMGMPLSSSLLGDKESHFGHDFSHVRLHTSSDAAELTEKTGADGLTSGSHIFLRPTLSPTFGKGAEVLNHELSHVLQQTGARRLNEKHDSSPVLGKPGCGLRIETGREAAAGRMADAAFAKSSEVVRVEGEGGEGYMPSMNPDILEKIMGILVGPKALKDLEGEVTKGRPIGKVKKVDLTSAEGLLGQVMKQLKNPASVTYSKFLKTKGVSKEVTTHVVLFEKEMKGALRRLISRSQKPVRKKRGTKPKKPETQFDPGMFVKLLQTFIFLKTGVAIDIDLDPLSKKKAKLKLEKLHIHFVDLGRMPLNNPLWDIAIKETQKVIKKMQILGKRKIANEDKLQIHRVLQLLGAGPFLWDRSAFRFSDKFLRSIARQRPGSSKTKIPDWDTYSNPDKSIKGPGLRVDTHGNNLKRSLSAGTPRRESHHIPQFLLIEYFQNKKNPKLFKNRYRRLPGFKPDRAGNPTHFEGDGKKIKMEVLGTGNRGPNMPAIWLAVETHKRGRLHVNQEPRWDNSMEGKASRTQAATVHNLFQKELPDNLKENAPIEKFRNFKKSGKGEAGVYKAMKTTYQWMYIKRMIPALRTALLTIERAHYEGFQERSQQQASRPGFKTAKGKISRVITAVNTANDTIMGSKGWERK